MMKRAVLIGAMAISLLAPIAGHAAGDPKKAEALVTDARKSLQKGDLKTAIIQLKNAVQADPDAPLPRFELGVAQLRAGDLLSAEKELRAAKERKHPDAQLAPAMAELFLRQRKFDELLKELPAGDRAPEAEGEIRLARGYAYLAKQQLADAEKSFDESRKLMPAPAKALLALARVKAAQNDLPSASELAKSAVEADANLVDARVLLGQLKRSGGDAEGARADYDKAIELQPRNEQARVARTQLLLEQNQVEPAQADIDAILKANPGSAMGSYLLAVVQARQQNWRAAEGTLQKLQNFLPSYPPGLYLLANVNMALGQFAQSEDAANRYLQLRPNDSSGTALLATIQVRRGNVPRAVDVLTAGLKTNPNDLRLLSLLSDAYIRQNQPEEASKVLDQITAIAPENSALRTQVATQHLRMGMASKAEADLSAVSPTAPGGAQAGILRILTFLQGDKIDDALKAATELRDASPNNPVAENLMGVVALRKFGPDESRKHFLKALEIKADFTPALMNLGNIEAGLKNYDAARGHFDTILKRDAINEPALLAQADLSIAQDKLDEAILYLEKARNGNPQATQSRARLSRAYLMKKDAPKAVSIAQELSRIAPTSPESLETLGQALLANNEAQAAITALRRLIELAPASPQANFQLAAAYSMAKDINNTRLTLERTLDLNPGDIQVIRTYVDFVNQNQQVESAIAFARDLAVRKPKDAAVDVLTGDLYASSGKVTEAVAAYKNGMAKGDNVLILGRMNDALVKAGDSDGAAENYRQWMAKYPDDSRTRFLLGSLYIAKGDLNAALTEHEVLLKADPNNPVVLNNIAWLYDTKGDSRALEFAEKASAVAPEAPTIADTLGWILLKKGEKDRALVLLEKAAGKAPNELAIQYHLAAAYKAVGRPADARKILEPLVKADKKFAELDEAKALLGSLPN